MNDKEIIERVHALVNEEHGLRDRRSQGELSEQQEHDRLAALEVALDQCWDLLRQRRARMAAGANPDDAQARSVSEVEGYQQ
ncbi:MAG: hypothetical protein QOE54_2951 [Streptosporangiaceae bacterium]|jgi:hypothetical protein|nr:hypothetical protein [Streptosporangiaceae bacterium]MDX6430585.1 hypothetical protein [Streptosporangiaceae bacterium]